MYTIKKHLILHTDSPKLKSYSSLIAQSVKISYISKIKKILLVSLILLCIFLCSCNVSTTMECGIDSNNNSFIKLNISVNTYGTTEDEKDAVSNTLQTIGRYYRNELGYEVDYEYYPENDDYTFLKLILKEPGDNFEDAFANLKKMLTNEELTPFSEISLEISNTKKEYTYRINGKIDAHKVLDNICNSGISQGTVNSIKTALENCSFSLVLTMPDKTYTEILSYTEPTNISLNGSVSTLFGTPISNTVATIRDRVMKYSIIGCSAMCSLLLIILIILIRKYKKRPQLPLFDSPYNQ